MLPGDKSTLVFTASLAAILCACIALRSWDFGSNPPGLNQDEASIGYEAHSLALYGFDRAGNSYPVHLVSWGSGQNAAYAYLAAPFATATLTPTSIRLPMLVAGCASIALLAYVTTVLFGRVVGVLSALLLTLSPWHIMLSRWALESNLLPAVFLAALACLAMALKRSRTGQVAWLAGSGAVFAACLYTYGTAYAAVPVFVVLASTVLFVLRAVSRRGLVAFLLTFAVLGSPIALFVAINTFHWNSVHLGLITVPRLPSPARYEAQSMLSSNTPMIGLFSNLNALVALLKTETDGLTYNTIPPYGVLYGGLLPLSASGVVALAIGARDATRRAGSLLFLAWVVAGLCTGVIGSMNVNRANILFVPLIVAVAVFIELISRPLRGLLSVPVVAVVVGCGLFLRAYYAPAYMAEVAQQFQSGYPEAMRFADSHSRSGVCVLADGNMPYIYTLFANPIDPRIFAATVVYTDQAAPFRRVASYAQYAFGNCDPARTDTYVERANQPPPAVPGNAATWSSADFSDLRVFYTVE